MIPVPSRARVWIAMGKTDMRKHVLSCAEGGMASLARQVEHGLKHKPYGGDLFIFRGRRGDLCKILWHDGVGMSLYAKRLERGRFIWPSAVDGVIAISASQLACLLEAIDWRNPQKTWAPEMAG